jgi:hypothetical protein
MKNVRLFLKSLIVLLFLYSRFTYYADSYPKGTGNILSKITTSLRSSADFVKHFADMSFIPHERSNIQKLEDFMMGLPAMRTMVDEAKHLYKEDIPRFWNELYTRLFSNSTIYNVSHHLTLTTFLYDTIILSVLLYFVYRDNQLSHIVLIADSIFSLITVLIYHFRETPLERLSNYFLSFFTHLKSMDIMSMFRSNWEILVHHRSVISTFVYMSILVGLYLVNRGFRFSSRITQQKRDSPVQSSRIPSATATTTSETKRQ